MFLRRHRHRPKARASWALLVLFTGACGDQGLLPSTVDPGDNFAVADVVFDDNFFYCRVEPILFAQKCGSGDPAQGDTGSGCHFAVTGYRLADYAPLVADTCAGGLTPDLASIPAAAQQNYRSSQARMKRDPQRAPLLLRPTGAAAHPRAIFSAQSDDAEMIRQWATRFSSQ